MDRAARGDSVHKLSMEVRLYKYMYITIAASSMCLGCLVALKIRTTTTITLFVKGIIFRKDDKRRRMAENFCMAWYKLRDDHMG